MKINNLNSNDIKNILLSDTPLVDVRAPVEFQQGSIPLAVNLPILNNEERARIGTVFKTNGRESAIKLGYELISGNTKEERVQSWISFLQKNPQAILYCFRGGLRSQITQQWLADVGYHRPLIHGGYKKVRNFLLESLETFTATQKLIPLFGPTGSGKTQFLEEIKSFYPAIDLEALAHHRGSAFGARLDSQPTQINFENELAKALLKIENRINDNILPLFEDESRLIGKCVLPNSLFVILQNSPVIWLDEPLDLRVDHIYQEYILNSPIGSMNDEFALPQFEKYKKSLQMISKKLGGHRTTEILNIIHFCEDSFKKNKNLDSNKEWINKLLTYYYDPMYLKSLERRKVKVLFKGNKSACLDYLKSL